MSNKALCTHLHLPDTTHWYMGDQCMDCRAVWLPANPAIEVVLFDYEKNQFEVVMPFSEAPLAPQ